MRKQLAAFGIFFLIALISSNAVAKSNKYYRERVKAKAAAARAVTQEGSEEILPPDVYIEVNIPATELILYENGKPLFVKPIAIGQGVYPTPEKESYIRKIEWNPWWYPPKARWAKKDKPTPPGPNNPMGLVKMALSDSILFHGTNKEQSVGRPASHGCMRMFNKDAVEIAWYLQSHFSGKKDPALRELYKKNSKKTYVVELDRPVSVRLAYKPLIVHGDKLVFYPDYYNQLKGKKKKKDAIIAAIAKSGISPEKIDEKKIKELAAHWPPRGTEVPIKSLLKSSRSREFKPKKRLKHRNKYRR